MSSSEAAVNVTGLSPTTTEAAIHEFFSFCGKIKSVERHEKSATITFEKESAAKTSLMLDGGTLDNAIIQVTLPSTPGGNPQTPTDPATPGLNENEEIKQEDKPRSAIAAEYLAHGYILGDQAIAKAIALDQKHGISSKFSNYFHKIQEKCNKAATHPPTTEATVTPATPTRGLNSLVNWSQQYYEKALSSKHGAKVKEFYTNTSKQVLDVHSEATRIAQEKTGHAIFQFPGLNKSAPSTEAEGFNPSNEASQAAQASNPVPPVEEKK